MPDPDVPDAVVTRLAAWRIPNVFGHRAPAWPLSPGTAKIT
ncbi:hypothetical protein [Micromonospora phaseoli]|nr:hypothetical protein [Micromonospora phaseoli]